MPRRADLRPVPRPHLVLPALLFTALVVVVYADPLFFRRNFAGRDLTVYNLPMEKAVHDAYARGRLPVWMPEISGGRPLLPNPNAGAMYPVRPLLSVLPFPMAMRLFPILHWIAAGIGMIALTRTLGASPAGAWIAATTYVFSGVGVSEVFFPHIHPGMALLPWVVWAVARPATSAAERVLPLGLLLGATFLAGDVFTGGLAILASVLWIAFERPNSGRLRDLLLLAAAVALAMLAAAPQIVATALWLPETNRAVLGMKLQESLFFSVSPFRLLELVVPFPYGSTWDDVTGVWARPVFRGKAVGVFTSLYAGGFALVAFFSTWKLRLPGTRFARILILLFFVIAIPPSLVPIESKIGRSSSPLPLRNPEKLSVALVFALGILAAVAVDRVRASARPLRWPFGVCAFLTAAAGAAAVFPHAAGRLAVALVGADRSFAETASGRLPATLAEGGLLWIATIVALDLLRRPRGSLLAVALLAGIPVTANRRIARTERVEAIFSPTRFSRTITRRDIRGEFRTLDESHYRPASQLPHAYTVAAGAFTDTTRRIWFQHTHALFGRGTVVNEDFDVGDLSRVQSLRRLFPGLLESDNAPAIFGSLALRFGIRFRDQEPLPGYRRFGGDAMQDWDELSSALPDVRLARMWTEESDGIGAVRTMPYLQEREIVLETGTRRRGSARAGRVRFLEKSPERLFLETDSPDPTWLFVLRGFWVHRTVTLDGRTVEDAPAQLAFSAVPVPAGIHRIDWRERVPGGTVSRWGPVLYLFITVGLVLRQRSRNRRELA